MNKQELIKKIKEMPVFATTISKIALVRQHEVIKLIEQLNQAKEVKLPQVAIDYIKHAKENDWDLQDALDSDFIASEENRKLSDWFYKDKNMETFALAWINGYIVKEEKRYLVKMKGVSGYCRYLNKSLSDNEYFFASENEIFEYRTKHTKKELVDDGFGEVFTSPLFEVKEVE